MPTTNTAFNACGVNVQLADAGGTLRDISGSANEVNLDFDNTLGEYKAFGDAVTYRLECGRDAALDLTLFYTQTANEGMDILKQWRTLRGKRTIQINAPSNASGNDRYQGSFLIEKISIPLKSDEAKPVMVKCSLKPTGDVTYSQIP